MSVCETVPPETENAAFRILLVEDDREDALILERVILRSDLSTAQTEHRETLTAAKQALAADDFDVVLLDLGLPDGDGISALPEIMQSGVPVLVLTGNDDVELALEAMRRGAQDYILKDCLDASVLSRSVRYAVERQRLHDELLASHRREQALKDEVLSHVSHELRTPLTAIYSYVGILSDGIAGPVTEQQAEYLGIIERNAKQLKRLIGDLMDVARINNHKLALDTGLVDMHSCIADVVDASGSAAAEKGIDLQVAVDGSLPCVLGDSQRATQVLQNLVDNAVKFTAASGHVTIGATEDRDQMVCVDVRDDGCGIAPELRSRLFERLQQGRSIDAGSRRGLGLGLWIAHELVLSMGGEMGVDSEEGEGSRFWFTLPVYSVERLVAEVLEQEATDLSLLHVVIRPPESVVAGCSIETARREAARLVERCLLATSDRLIPEQKIVGSRVHVFAILRSDERGAEVVGRRVEAQLGSATGRLARCGYTYSVTAEQVASSMQVESSSSVAQVVEARIDAVGKGRAAGSSKR